MTIKPGERVLVPTGLSMEIPFGYEVQVRPRSGLSLKSPLMIVNAPGTIDCDYRGEVCIIVGNFGKEAFKRKIMICSIEDWSRVNMEEELRGVSNEEKVEKMGLVNTIMKNNIKLLEI